MPKILIVFSICFLEFCPVIGQDNIDSTFNSTKFIKEFSRPDLRRITLHTNLNGAYNSFSNGSSSNSNTSLNLNTNYSHSINSEKTQKSIMVRLQSAYLNNDGDGSFTNIFIDPNCTCSPNSQTEIISSSWQFFYG